MRRIYYRDSKNMPDDISFKDAAIQIVSIGDVFEHLEELSDEERDRLIDLVITKVKLSDEEIKEIDGIREEMDRVKVHILEDVLTELAELNV